ncbi:Fic family protein [Volucribacter amazonae]|uniref:protein adenylyltransferase n=1 Tax=Volucribacter amazonae TaxID=256731 RepID=A0A9X4PFE1_9PAST|nr:Fic family protein [Volucribacter amazonae]MDG6896391.1 cell filamentation protein Fic [Volucribacter amazonae]
MNKGYSENELKDKRSFRRILELQINPIKGDFNLEHLKKINSYIFQDSPDVAGKFRPEVKIYSDELWHKNRNYPKFGEVTVCYSPMDKNSIKEAENVLGSINIEYMKELNQNELAKELADIYKKLDYFHPFPDGNSRTLREFTRTLSEEVGFKLDWSKHNQQEIYLARDFEVNTITLSKVSDQNQKIFLKDEIEAILKHPEYKPLENIINDSLSPLALVQQKNYQIDFSFNKEQSEKLGKKSYDVLVNGTKADELLKKDNLLSKALEGLAMHKDMQQKGITAEALKSGTIQPLMLNNELKVNRPESRVINALGSRIETQSKNDLHSQKTKSFSL